MLKTICQWFKNSFWNSFKHKLTSFWYLIQKRRPNIFSHLASQVKVSSFKNLYWKTRLKILRKDMGFCNVSTPAMHCGTFHRGDLRTVVSMATTSLAQFDLAATEPNLCGDVSPSCGNPQMLLWVYANMSSAVSVQIIPDVRGEQYQNMIFYEC